MLDEKGFKRKRFADIFADMEAKAKEVFGEKINTSERSPLGVILRLFAWFLGLLWQQLENVYNSAYVDKASGRSLEYVGKYVGIKMRGAEKAAGVVVVSGDPGISVVSGSRFATKTNIVFETTKDVVIQANGKVDVPVRALLAGPTGNVPSGAIEVVVNPMMGISGVTNPSEMTGGREKETDTEFRQRYDRSVAAGGSSTVESIVATLLALPGVRDCQVEENETMETVNDVPGKSVAPFVFGGEDNQIAQAIYKTKAGGIQSWGETVVQVADSKGKMHPIGFTRPTEVDVFAAVSIETDQNFPANGHAMIRTALIQYIGGQDQDGTIYSGVGLGQDVIYTKAISALYKVSGIVDVQLKLGLVAGSLTPGNVTIGPRQVAKTDWQKVAVS
ncbi:baseplate J/gp47 family protein [Brevibacillus parabrevis]|uniref:baseplate J/gp47 family protein n=1 Tax=Brevibacillus parabrevis TaxID=54914 RepID=UPI00285313F5|nr:baseplate J/gp47 family protein [Brevibacillus parabrevis]MDR4997901.1 baseplate J/gp47 family protein [Brevibacillus parabrevis]